MTRTIHRACDLLHHITKFVAITAIGTGTVHGQRRGVLTAIRKYLRGKELHPWRFPKTQRGFRRWLDRRTEGALSAMKSTARGRPWGLARKAVNLFLRDCIYNHYLRRQYGLSRMEPWLEVPLDSIVARELRRLAKKTGRGPLPVWRGLKRLTPEENAQFQDFASWYALEKVGLKASVFLDNYLWPSNR